MKIDFFNHLQLALDLQIIMQIIADPFHSFTELWPIEFSLSLIHLRIKSCGVTIRSKPLWQNYCIVLLPLYSIFMISQKL